MAVFFNKLLMTFLLWILKLLDGIFEFFKQLVGIDTVRTSDTGDVSLVEYFLGSSTVTQVFWSIFLISIFVMLICVIVAIIKNIFTQKAEGQRSHAKIVGQGISSVVLTLIMAGVLLGGMVMSNFILVEVNSTFAGENTSLATQIIDISVEKTYEIDITETEKILNNKDENDDYIHIIYKEILSESGWLKKKNSDTYYSIADIDIQKETANTIFGSFNKSFGFENINSKPKYAKIKIDSFNFLIAYFGAVALIITVTMACLGLVKRLYDLILLFLALPLITATIPLDDGAKFKQWRETAFSKVMLAYGTIFAINIFLVVMPLVMGLQINTILRLLLIVGGAMSINGAQILFARLMGTSAEESREMMQGARSLIAGGIAAGGAVRFAKNAAVGGRDKFGVQHRGALRAAGGAAAGAINKTGAVLGGNAYRGSALGRMGSSVENALKGIGAGRGGGSNAYHGGDGTTGAEGALKGDETANNSVFQRGGLIGATGSAIKSASDARKTAKNKDLAKFGLEQLEKGVIILPEVKKGNENKENK